jgi:carbonic anhydrase
MNSRNKNYGKKVMLLLAIVIATLSPISTPALAGEVAPHWHYGGAENPTQWGSLSKDFALCESGRDQSPINIKNTVESTPSKISFDYKTSPLVVVNNGHTIQVNYAEGSTVTIDGEKYALVQFHFHTPSEHEINDKATAMELHLVHRNEAGKLAVVGVMLTKGKANPLIEEVWKNIPATGKTNTVSDITINAAKLLPSSKAYYSYAGSLTTPPCSEGVKWNVFVEPMTISEEQIEAFEKLYQVDARPIQPINGRSVQLHR